MVHGIQQPFPHFGMICLKQLLTCLLYTSCGEFSERFIREGLLLDLTPYLEADQEWKDSLMETQMVEYTLSLIHI